MAATEQAAPTLDEIRQISEERGIEFYFAQFVDMYARPSAKLIPAEHLDALVADGAGSNQLAYWSFHTDWTSPANTTLTGPTTLATAAFTPPCNGGGTCVTVTHFCRAERCVSAAGFLAGAAPAGCPVAGFFGRRLMVVPPPPNSTPP